VKFSIITPSLNQGRYLPDCISSVGANGNSIEHIVIDAGSTDSTLDILRSNPNVRWISEPDRGQSHAINKGLALATGDLLAYLCADDLYEPGALEKVHTAFAQNPDADIVHADFFFLEGDSGRKRLKHSAHHITPSLLEKHNPLGQPAVWWRRRVYEKFGGFDESLHFCMDHEYWLRIAADTRWHHIPEPLATCRLHADAKTSRQLPAAWHETARMLTREKFRLKPWWDYANMLLWGHHCYRAKRWWFSR
jgi:glycosyltransferase involved in cell wall biosynthesis